METLEEAAKRELEEETSLIATDLEIFSVSDDIKGEAHYVTMGFLAKDYMGEVKTMEPETILEWKWFDIDELPENMYMPSAKCIEKYKSGVIY
jgi:ADP-ribose pyrophosphatase YjhB (NUDIX family)